VTHNSCRDRRSRRQSGLKVSHAPQINGLPGAKVAVVTTRNEQRAQEAADSIAQRT
jgi:hypothetical protein